MGSMNHFNNNNQEKSSIMEYRKLYRSRTDRKLAGICGGLGIHFGMDPVIIRIIFIVLTLFGGSGLLLYFIMVLVVPDEPGDGYYEKKNDRREERFEQFAEEIKENAESFGRDVKEQYEYYQEKSQVGRWVLAIIGVLLIGAGIIWLLSNFLPLFSPKIYFPAFLILIGLIILLTSFRNTKN